MKNCIDCTSATQRGQLCADCAAKKKDPLCRGGCGCKLVRFAAFCGQCLKSGGTANASRATDDERDGGAHTPAVPRFRKPRTERQWKELRAYADMKGIKPESLYE